MEAREVIYADNAATTKLDIDVFDAMKPFLLEDYSNPSQPYSFSRESKNAIKNARKSIAFCIGADPEEIYFTSCGTESDNWAIKSGGESGIATSIIEHHAILNSCKSLEKKGVKVIYAPVNSVGEIDITWLEKNLSSEIKLVSIMFANNEIGTIQPIEELAKIAHRNNCVFHTDAVQAVGHININVHEMGIDMLSASAHKFNGPKGIGFLYIKKGVILPAFFDGGGQERGGRAGTENVPSIVGMAVALQKNCDHIKQNENYIRGLEEKFIHELQGLNIDFIRNGSNNRIPGNVSLSFRGCNGEMLLHRLDLMGICVSTGSACDSENIQISHVIQAINVSPEYAHGTIRISLGINNTENEVIKIARSLKRIIN